jgi:MFS family permease
VLARQIVAKDAVGRVMGLLGTMSAIGTALGPSLGGVLTAQFGWRAIFLGLVALSAVSIALVAIALPASDPEKDRDRGGFDIVGTVLLALSVSVYALALSGASGSRFNFGLFLLALLGAGLFVLVELRTARPLVDLNMLRDADLSSGLGSNMLVSTVIMATLVVGPFYLSMALDLSATAVGFIVSVGPVIAALSGVPAGRMVDKFGSGAILAAGLTQVLGACIGLALLPRSMGIVGYIVAIAVLTSGYQLFLAANNTAIMIGAREDRKGVISGLLTLSRNLGLSTGAALMGGIFASLIQGSGMANPEAVARGMNATFAFAAVLIVIALVVTIWTRRNLRDRPVSGQPAG